VTMLSRFLCASVLMTGSYAVPLMRGALNQVQTTASLPEEFQVNGADVNPADPVLYSIEQSLATTFFKLNRTVAFKRVDDEGFAVQLQNATAVVDAIQKPIAELKAKIADGKKKGNEAEQNLIKLVAQSKDLNESIATLRKVIAIRSVAQEKLVTQVSDWKDRIVGDSSNRLRDLKRSSEQLLQVVKESKVEVDSPSRVKAPGVIQSTDGDGTVTSQVGVTVLTGAGVPTMTPHLHDETETAFISLAEEPVEDAEDAVGFDGVYNSILGMVKEYSGAEGDLTESVKQQIERQKKQIPEQADDNTVHQVVLDQLLQTRSTIYGAIEAQRKAISDEKLATVELSNELAQKTLELKAAQSIVNAIETKKEESDAYYLKHILVHRQTIDFAKDTLKEMESRAVKLFNGTVASSSMRKMKEEIERTLDLCSKIVLVPKKEEQKAEPPCIPPCAQPSGFVHHVNQKTVAQASSQTVTDEIYMPLPLQTQ